MLLFFGLFTVATSYVEGMRLRFYSLMSSNLISKYKATQVGSIADSRADVAGNSVSWGLTLRQGAVVLSRGAGS